MGVFSNRDIEREDELRKPSSNKKIPKYQKDYDAFRRKYKSNTPRRTMEPKHSSRDFEEENDLEL